MGHTRDLVELSIVDKVRSVSVNQGAEGQSVLPASPAGSRDNQVRGQKSELYDNCVKFTSAGPRELQCLQALPVLSLSTNTLVQNIIK